MKQRQVFAPGRKRVLSQRLKKFLPHSAVQQNFEAFVLLSVAVLALVATGCKNTARGVGEDVEKVGEKIQEKTK